MVMGGIILFASTKTQNRKAIAKTDVMASLMEGNERFVKGEPKHPDESPKYRMALAQGQHPNALVITCSDSRVCPELIFDQGLGDLFVIRTAGNLISEMEFGSIEYAVEHLGVKEIIVMGHENCGAVVAFMNHEPLHGHVQTIADSLGMEPEMKTAMANGDLAEAIEANIRHQMTSIANNELIKEVGEKKPVRITGAYYSLNSGKVHPLKSTILH